MDKVKNVFVEAVKVIARKDWSNVIKANQVNGKPYTIMRFNSLSKECCHDITISTIEKSVSNFYVNVGIGAKS